MKQYKEKICLWCNESFIWTLEHRKYCSDDCKKKARVKYKKEFNVIYNINNKFSVRSTIQQWRKDNPDKVKESSKKQRLKDTSEIKLKRKEITKIWKNNKLLEDPNYIKNYRKQKYDSDINYKLAMICRARITQALKNISKFSKSLKLLGCTGLFYKNYLESKFQNGMTWENHGEWEIDHIIPIASFDLTKKEEQEKCFHYTNTQPLWKNDNRTKGAKI